MKKRISAIIISFILCLILSVPVFSAGASYIIDESGSLTDSETASLNSLSESLANYTNCDILYVYTRDEDMDYIARSSGLGKLDNKILMIENDEYWDVYLFGEPEDYITPEQIQELRDAYMNGGETFSDSIAEYMYAASMIVQQNSLGGGVETGSNNTLILDTPTRMVDMADILTDSEEAALQSKLDELSERQQLDVVIVTVNYLGEKSRMEYADDFYDYNGYGMGSDRDGVLYLVRIEPDGSYSTGNSWISTRGYGITAFTDEGIQYIGEQITPELLDGSYNAAFEEYITLADDFIAKAKSGDPYDSGNLPKEPFSVGTWLLFSLIVGIIVALVGTGAMKGKLKTVRMQSAASDYLKKDSLDVTDSRDIFLYSHVDRRERPKNNSSSGGSSTHTSSSGSTHGGGGF